MSTRKLNGPLGGDYVTDGSGNAVPFTTYPIDADDELSKKLASCEARVTAAEVALPTKQDANSNISLISSTNRLDDNKRLRITTSQKQEAENNYDGGEVLWFDLENPLAKAMITWRMRYDASTREVYAEGEAPVNAPYQRVVWAGAHWFAQDQNDDDNPTDIHGHWSVETPDIDGRLRTRFQIFFNDRSDPTRVGSEVALISTNRADVVIDRQQNTESGAHWGRFVIAGSQSLNRGIEFARGDDSDAGRRWFMGENSLSESGSDVGCDFVLRRHDDNGDLLGHSIYIRRSNGEVTIGSSNWAPASNPAQVFVAHDGGEQSGVVVQPTSALTTGSAYIARHQTASELSFRVRVTTGGDRLQIRSDGRVSWGDGSSIDTHLYRQAANRLRIEGDIVADQSLRIGANPAAAGGVGVLVMANATIVPSGVPAGRGIIYVEGGALKYLGGSGTATTIAAA